MPKVCSPPTRSLASLSAAAEYGACSEKTIRRRIADGTLTGYRMGPRLIRVDLNELDEILRPIPTAGDGLMPAPPGVVAHSAPHGGSTFAGTEDLIRGVPGE